MFCAIGFTSHFVKIVLNSFFTKEVRKKTILKLANRSTYQAVVNPTNGVLGANAKGVFGKKYMIMLLVSVWATCTHDD